MSSLWATLHVALTLVLYLAYNEKRVKSPGISMHTDQLDAVEVEYVG